MTEIKLEKRYPHSRMEDITDAFMRGYQQGYKAKEYDRERDCGGCKYEHPRIGERCEGCCRNYADGYVAEQTEPKYDAEEVAKDINRRVDMIQKAYETMSCQECKYWTFDTRWDWFCPLKGQDECKYKPKQTEPKAKRNNCTLELFDDDGNYIEPL